jgi:hypothetical protein
VDIFNCIFHDEQHKNKFISKLLLKELNYWVKDSCNELLISLEPHIPITVFKNLHGNISRMRHSGVRNMGIEVHMNRHLCHFMNTKYCNPHLIICIFFPVTLLLHKFQTVIKDKIIMYSRKQYPMKGSIPLFSLMVHPFAKHCVGYGRTTILSTYSVPCY